MNIQIQSGQTKSGRLILIDEDANQPIAAGFINHDIRISDESIIAVTANAESGDGSLIDFTGLAAGNATVHLLNTAQFTDSNGVAVSQSKDCYVEVQILAEAHSTTEQIQF